MTILSRLFGSRSEPITLQRFNELRTAEPRRLCFGTMRKLSRGTDGRAVGFLSLNFCETIETLLPWSLDRYDGKFGRQYRRIIRSESEFAEIESWTGENSDVVFIRSLLEVCVAAGAHMTSPGQHTAIGDLELRAKYGDDQSARDQLLELLEAVFRRLFKGLEIDALCAVPASKLGGFSLPVWLAGGLAQRLGVEDITPRIRWAGPKPSLKEVDVDQKWASLERVGLEIELDVKGRRVLIIDDLYQSGATVHFVASRLQAAGADELNCLAVVKSLGDSDNT